MCFVTIYLPTPPPKKLPKLGTHPLGKIKKIVQNLVHEIVQKNSPMVQGSTGPVHILPYAELTAEFEIFNLIIDERIYAEFQPSEQPHGN